MVARCPEGPVKAAGRCFISSLAPSQGQPSPSSRAHAGAPGGQALASACPPLHSTPVVGLSEPLKGPAAHTQGTSSAHSPPCPQCHPEREHLCKSPKRAPSLTPPGRSCAPVTQPALLFSRSLRPSGQISPAWVRTACWKGALSHRRRRPEGGGGGRRAAARWPTCCPQPGVPH